jgi:hypothetical protein
MTMKLKELSELAEKLRKNVIGDPVLDEDKDVFEYSEKTIEVVVILKLLRAVQGVKSQILLCQNGLFTDMGALHRCVDDCDEEVYFLLEEYPKASEYVDQFIKSFFEHTIDGYDSAKTPAVSKKIKRSAALSFKRAQIVDEELIRQSEKLIRMSQKKYKNLCGYIHADYAPIMATYGGIFPNQSFNLLGVSSVPHKELYMQLANLSYITVLRCMSFVCSTFDQKEIEIETDKLIYESHEHLPG